MANTHRYGFRFQRSITGGGDTPQVFTFPITSGYAPVTVVGAGTSVNLNIGDPVRFSEGGAIELVQAGQDVAGANTDSDDYAFGIIVGFPRVIVGGFPRPGSFYTTGTTYTGGIGGDNAPLVSVIPVAGNIFEIDSSAIVSGATKNAAMALVGGTATMTYSVLTSGTGQPKANPLIDVSTVAAGSANQLQLVITGLGKANDAMDFTATNVTFQVMWNSVTPFQFADPAVFGANVE
jgi:hypothetical protein